MRTWQKYAAVASVALVLTATGCSRSDSGSNELSAVELDEGPATGEISIWAFGASADALEEIAVDFEAENPEADVKVTAVAWESAHDKIATAIAAGTTPDISEIGGTWMSEFAPTGALAKTPEALTDPDSFFDSSWRMLEVDDTAYGYPWYAGTMALYYRADLAAAAGLEAPTTWEELHAFAAGIQAGGAEHGIYLPPAGWDWPAFTFIPTGWQAGGEILTSDESGFAFDTPEWAEALTWYDSFFEDGLAVPRELAYGEWESALHEGSIGAFISTPDDIATLRGYDAEGFENGKFAVAPLPAGPVSNTSYYGGSNLAVFEGSDNASSAWKFVSYLSMPEVQTKFFELTTNLPANLDAWEGDWAKEPAIAAYGEQLGSTIPMPAIPTITQITAEVDATIEQVTRGGVSVADALASLQKRAEAIGVGSE